MNTDVMSFIGDNYIIIILVTVIIVMTIVGYIADKKDFGKKDKDNLKKSKKKVDNQGQVDIGQEIIAESNEEFVDAPQNDVVPEDINIIDSFEMPTNLDPVDNQNVEPVEPSTDNQNVEPVEPSTDNQNVESVEPSIDNQTVEPVEPSVDSSGLNDSFEEPKLVEESNIDTIQSTESIDSKDISNENDNSLNEESNNDNNLNEFNSIDENAVTSNNMEFDTTESPEEFKLPNIENLDDQLIDNTTDDDVWKF